MNRAAVADQTTTWMLPPGVALDATGILQCVPYARFLSGIGLHGDAWTWWDQAAGFYARGNQPEPGAVLSFPGNDRMPLGHVAVVTQVLGARKILIDHANWPNAFVEHGAISHAIQVDDVSPANDWTEVRVQFGEGGPMGSIYPVNGFIYGWTETGARIAQPRFLPEDAPPPPEAASFHMFNAINYYWALPPAERKKAFAAAGVAPTPGAPAKGRQLLVLNIPSASMLTTGALVQPMGVTRLDARSGARPAANRYVVQWATVTR
jgi:surface antigen